MLTSEKMALVFFLGGIVSVYALEIFYILAFAANKLRPEKTRNVLLTRRAICVHFLAAIGIACFLYGYFIEPYRIEVKNITIKTEKLSKTGLRLVQISDLHCDRKLRNEKKVTELVNALKPDVVVFTGDALNTQKALPQLKDTLKKIKADIAKLAVHGNIDVNYWSRLDLFGDTGFDVLEQQSIKLQKNKETFHISGLSCKYPHAFHNLLKNIPDNHFSIFLYHYPDLIENMEGLNADLYLTGHTHGGQIALPIYGAIITLSKFGRKYQSGMYTVGDTILYVNRGIGTEGDLAPRVRFCARPEITVFDIMPENNSKN